MTNILLIVSIGMILFGFYLYGYFSGKLEMLRKNLKLEMLRKNLELLEEREKKR